MTDNQNPTAVVVNDDVTQLRVLSGLLRKNGFETQMFETAQDALAAMDQERPPDLIVTDLYMPGIDGWRFCRLLRSSEYLTSTRCPSWWFRPPLPAMRRLALPRIWGPMLFSPRRWTAGGSLRRQGHCWPVNGQEIHCAS